MHRLASLLLALSSCAPLHAGDLPTAPLHLLLGTAAPWTYFDQDCGPAGIGIDLMRAVGRESGVAIDFRHVPYEDEKAALLDGRLDGDMNEINAWYDEHLIRIAPVMALEEVLIGHAGREQAPRAVPRRIGHVSTHNSRRETLADLPAEIVEFDDYAPLASAYLRGELDAVAGIKETLLFHLYRLGATPDILETLQHLQTVSVWLYLRSDVDSARRTRLQEVLLGDALDPVLQQAKAMHLGAHHLRQPRDPASCYPAPAGAGATD